jgi:hypothetical protein
MHTLTKGQHFLLAVVLAVVSAVVVPAVVVPAVVVPAVVVPAVVGPIEHPSQPQRHDCWDCCLYSW